MVQLKHRIDGNFIGTDAEYKSIIPEGTIESLLSILKIDGSSVSPHKPDKTIKENLWLDIVHSVRQYSKPQPTKLGIDVASQKKFHKQLQTNILNAKKLINSLTYAHIFPNNMASVEFNVGQRLRRASNSSDKSSAKRKIDISADGAAESYYYLHGNYPDLYPLDEVINRLVFDLEYLNNLLIGVEPDFESPKISKNFDVELFFSFCQIYYWYTQELPKINPSSISKSETQKFSGKFLPFIKILLPFTHYEGNQSDAALRQMLVRIKKLPNKKKFWE